MSSIKALSSSKTDVFLRHDSDNASINFKKNGRVTIKTSLDDEISFALGGNNPTGGSIDSTAKLFKGFAADNQFNKKKIDDFEHVHLSYLNNKGKQVTQLIELDSDPTVKNGNLIIEGSTEYTSKLHKKIARSFNNQSSDDLVGKSVLGSDVELIFSSFDGKELRNHHNSYHKDFWDSNGGSSRLELQLIDENDNSIDEGRSSIEFGTWKLLNETVSFGDNGEAGFSLEITPGADASFNAPDLSWYEAYKYMNPSLYTANANISLKWEAKAFVDPGRLTGSKFEVSKDFTGPSSPTFGSTPVNGKLTSGVRLGAYADGVSDISVDDLTLGVSQTLGLGMGISSKGISLTPSATSLNWQKPSLDKLTGIEVGATATPWAGLNIGVGFNIPYFGAVNFADITGKVNLPVDFKIAATGISGRISGNLSADANLLPFLEDNSFTWNSPSINLFGPTNII